MPVGADFPLFSRIVFFPRSGKRGEMGYLALLGENWLLLVFFLCFSEELFVEDIDWVFPDRFLGIEIEVVHIAFLGGAGLSLLR